MHESLEGLVKQDAVSFAADVFGRKRLVVEGPAARYEDVLTLGDVEELLLTLTSPADTSWLRLVRKGTTLPVVSHMLDTQGMLNTSVLFERFARGYSIVLNQVHRRSATVRKTCSQLGRDLESAAGIFLSGEVFANAYLSPPGSQGFRPHTDSEHVFVLQLSGRKRWALWPRQAPAPVSSQEGLALEPSDPVETVDLKPGDLLYLPGGLPHAARTLENQHSLHLSIGVRPVTAATILDAAVARSETLGAVLPRDGREVDVAVSAEKTRRLALAARRRASTMGPAEPGVLGRLLQPLGPGDQVKWLESGGEGLAEGTTLIGRGCRRFLNPGQVEALSELSREGSMEVGDSFTPEFATMLVACGFAAPSRRTSEPED